jgi:hypothetical protein
LNTIDKAEPVQARTVISGSAGRYHGVPSAFVELRFVICAP